jgi:hypothetical protein
MSFDPTYTIPAHTRRQFQDSFSAQIQQVESRFAVAQNNASDWTAKQYVKRMSGQQTWRVNNGRFGKNLAKEFVAGFRSGFWQTLEMEPVKFDQHDKAKLDTISLPTSDVIRDGKSAFNRLCDDLFLTAALADSLGGEDPYVTPTVFPTANVIPVNYIKAGVAASGASSGMTIWKILRAKKYYEDLSINLDQEELFLAMSPDDKMNLLLSAEAAPNEAWAKITLDWVMKMETGQKDAKLFGFTPIITTRLSTATVSSELIESAIAFSRRAFCWCPMMNIETRIEQGSIEDRNMITVGANATHGVFREHDELVLNIKCLRV